MRILLTADPELPVPPEHYGGIERIIDILAKELRSRGHCVGLVANEKSTCKSDSFYSWPGEHSQKKIDTFRNTMTLWKAVKKFQPDVLHSFSRLQYMLPLLYSKLPKIMSYQRKPTEHAVKKGAMLSRGSLTFTGCSEHICQEGKKAGGKWTSIHNCVEINKYQFRKEVPSDAPLVFLSRIERIKGAHTAIKVAQNSGRRLIIAGNYSTSGEEGRYWSEEIVPHLDKNGIQYVGTINDTQKNDILGTAAAMIVPIEWEEPFGIVFIEALACGTPVISCPFGAVQDIICHGREGFLIKTIEEGCTAVNNISKINRLDCRRKVEDHFSSKIITKEYEKLYKSLVA